MSPGHSQGVSRAFQRNSTHSRSPHSLKIRQNPPPHPVRFRMPPLPAGNAPPSLERPTSSKSDKNCPIPSENGDTHPQNEHCRPPLPEIRQIHPHSCPKTGKLTPGTETQPPHFPKIRQNPPPFLSENGDTSDDSQAPPKRDPPFPEIGQIHPHSVRKRGNSHPERKHSRPTSPKSDRIRPLSCPKTGILPTTVKPHPRKKPRSSKSDKIHPIPVRKRDEASTQTPTRLMYGGFRTLIFPKWLIYGTHTPIPQVRTLQFRAPYSAYRVSGAIYKPLSISPPHESAIYRRNSVPPHPFSALPRTTATTSAAPIFDNRTILAQQAPMSPRHHPHSQKTFRKMPPLFKPHSTKPVESRTTLLPEATTDGHRRQPAVPATGTPTIAGATASSHRPTGHKPTQPNNQQTATQQPTNSNTTTSTMPSNRRRQQRQHPDHAEPHPM